jgi:hypothetical protein
MVQRIFALLLIAVAFSLAHANPASDLRPPYFAKDSIQAEQHAAFTQVDFDGYYENLIQSEKDEVQKATYVSIGSGVVTGFGVFATVIAFRDKGQTKENSYAETHRQMLQIGGIAFTAIGTFGLIRSIYTIISCTGENSKRASYENAYEIYKRRHSELKNETDGAKVILTPTVDLLGATAGLNLNILF